MTDTNRNPDGSFGNFGRWPEPAPRTRRRWPTAALLAAVLSALGIAALPGLGLAHHIDITRTCSSVTIESFSDGTMSVLAQTGGVFAVGQTAPPGNPGLLTKPAAPAQAGSVTVTWTTDSSHETVTWGESVDCTPVTTPSTAPPTTPSTAPPTTPSTAPPTTPSTAPPTTPSTAPPTTQCEDSSVHLCHPGTTLPPTTLPPPVSTVCTARDIGSACAPSTTSPATTATSATGSQTPVAASPRFTG